MANIDRSGSLTNLVTRNVEFPEDCLNCFSLQTEKKSKCFKLISRNIPAAVFI